MHALLAPPCLSHARTLTKNAQKPRQKPTRNDLLGEYTGDLITQEEANRRGKAYDRDDNSYLFDLTLATVIDARRRGNKLRFVNHDATNPNCRPEIRLVDGEARIGLFAAKEIPVGEELLFNYGYAQDNWEGVE